MAWAEIILSEKLLLVFRCFTNKMVLFGFGESKQLILVSKIILTDPYVTFRDLHGRKPYKFGVQVSRLCSMRAFGLTQRNRFTQTSLSKVYSMYWQKYKSQIVGQFPIQLLTFKHPEGFQLALPNSKTQFQIFTFDICVEKV